MVATSMVLAHTVGDITSFQNIQFSEAISLVESSTTYRTDAYTGVQEIPLRIIAAPDLIRPINFALVVIQSEKK